MKLKKLLACLIALTALCSCGGGEKSPVISTKSPNVEIHGEAVESAIFGRSVSYNAFSPADEITLPISFDKILSQAQIEKALYFLSDGGVWRLDLESGESDRIFDTGAAFIAADGARLFAYGSGVIGEYSPEGELISEREINVEKDGIAARGLIVADGCFCFTCTESVGGITVTENIVFDRETLNETNKIPESDGGAMSGICRVFARYKGNKILKAEESLYDSRFVNICEIDLESGKTKRLTSVEAAYPGGFALALAYLEKTGTALIFSAPTGDSRQAPFLMECSLTDPDSAVLKRFYPDGPAFEGAFLSVYENIASAVVPPGEILLYDFADPPESVTLACQSASNYAEIIRDFERETGATVKTVSYGTDFERLDVKLMAGDTDFDLYEPVYMHQVKYFLAGMFEDLTKYDGLNGRISGNPAIEKFCGLNGAYVGVPTYLTNGYTRENYPEDGSRFCYSRAVSQALYLAQNVDVTEGVFLDASGEELYKLLKYFHDFPNGGEEKMPFGSELKALCGGFLVMNPSSGKKDLAARFMECVLDAGENGRYADIPDPEGYFVQWRFFASAFVEPVLTACNEATESDGKASTLRALAREAAEEVGMRMGE